MQTTFSNNIIFLTMEYYLHPLQSVVAKDFHVTFRHYTRRNTIHEFNLNWRQVQNLNDLIVDLRSMKPEFLTVRHYPIGGGVWLSYNRPIIQLKDHERKREFLFYVRSWDEYLRRGHRTIYAFVRYGQKQGSNHKYDADDESERHNQSGKGMSHLQMRYKILSRSSRDGYHENVKRSQSTVFSRRKGSNSRTRSPVRGGKYGTRINRQIEDDREDGEISSDEFGNEEHGTECSIEEGSVSGEDIGE